MGDIYTFQKNNRDASHNIYTMTDEEMRNRGGRPVSFNIAPIVLPPGFDAESFIKMWKAAMPKMVESVGSEFSMLYGTKGEIVIKPIDDGI